MLRFVGCKLLLAENRLKPGTSSVVFKQLFEFGRQSLFLLRDVEQNKQDIAELQRELETTNDLVRQLAYEIQRINEREINEREKTELRLQNALLRFEHLLTSAKSSKKRKR